MYFVYNIGMYLYIYNILAGMSTGETRWTATPGDLVENLFSILYLNLNL